MVIFVDLKSFYLFDKQYSKSFVVDAYDISLKLSGIILDQHKKFSSVGKIINEVFMTIQFITYCLFT